MTSLKHLWTTRITTLALLLLTLASSVALLLPVKADALICCGRRITINYYSDASKTVWVGRCINDDCAGTETCTGQQTVYFTTFGICCDNCS